MVPNGVHNIEVTLYSVCIHMKLLSEHVFLN